MSKNLFCISLLVFFFTCYSSPSFTQKSQLSWIKVKGNLLVDEEGQQMIFHGLNTSDPDKLEEEGHWNEAYFAEIKSWGANLVRFPVHPEAWRSRGQESYLELLDKGIEMATKQGMYVIIDWHSIGNLRSELFHHDRYKTTMRETFEFWQIMAQRYGQNPTVAFFELYNEPTTFNGRFGLCSWEQWKEIIEEMIIIIRAYGAKNIPLVAGFNWAYDLTAMAENPIAATGIAYVSHPYPQKRKKPWEEKWTADWGFVAKKYPLILTEIGFCEADQRGAHVPVISDESYGVAIQEYCKKKGISYVVWVFDPHWSPSLLEDWTFKPTKHGQFWKNTLGKY